MDEHMLIQTKTQEYMMLRDEMNDEMKAQDSVFNICLTSTAAVLAFAFTHQQPLVLLASYMIIYYCLEMFIRHRERVLRISGYLIVYLEPIIGFTWETHGNWAHINQQVASEHKVFWKTPHYHVWGVLAITTFISSVIIDSTLHTHLTFTEILKYFIQLCLMAKIYLTSLKLAQTSNIRAERVEYWMGIKSKFEKASSNK